MKLIFACTLLFTCLAFTLPKPKVITIFMAGDSTMANKPKAEHPERGWGMMLQDFFDDKVRVENIARNGRSTKTFLSEGLWQSILDKIKKGDYVIIQFGHNDSVPSKVNSYTTPAQYKANLIRYVSETRARKATPILCTPIMRRRFDESGQFYDTHGEYPDIVRQLADSLRVPLVDMHRSSEKLIVAHGEAASKKIFLHFSPGEHKLLPDGLKDDTHFSTYGARQMAALFVEDLRSTKTKLVKHLRNDTPGK